MKREFKFRAFDVDMKAMHYNVIVGGKIVVANYNAGNSEDEDDDDFEPTYWTIKNDDSVFIVMQATGLLDKNGKEIYEGDKVKCLRPDGTDTGNEDVIEFKNGCFYLRHRNINVEAWTHYEARDGESWSGQFEIIGNIYKNN